MTPDPTQRSTKSRPGQPQAGAAFSWRSLLTGNVGALALASLLNDTASEIIFPLLPLFLVGSLGAGPAFLGILEGIAETTSAFVKLWSGWFSDRIHRRKELVASGYGIAALARPLMAVALAPWHVLALRFSDRVGKGIRGAPRDALLAASVPGELRGRAFAAHRAADHAGAVLGPLLGAFLLWVFAGELRPVFALAAIPGAAAVWVILRRVREVAPHESDEVRAGKAVGGEPIRSEGQEPEKWRPDAPFLWYLGALLLFTLGNASDAFLLLRASDLGIPVAAIPLLWGVHNVSKMVFNPPGGALADRLPPRIVITLGWLVYAAVYGGFAVATQAWQIWGLMIAYGVFFGLTEAPEKALVARLAPPEARGRAFGVFHFVVGLGALPASVLFGVIWEWKGAGAAFSVGASLALLASLVLLAGLRSRGAGNGS